MEALKRIGVSVLVVLFLTGGISYGQSTVEEIYNKGMEYATEGKFKEAKEEFEKALRLDSFCVPAEESLQRVEDIISQKIKRRTGIYLFKGVVYRNRGYFFRAIVEIDKAITIDPGYAPAYNDRGGVYDLKGEYDSAISDYTKALKINARYTGAYNNRGVSYYNKGQYDRAVLDYTKAIEINPGYALAYTNRGQAYASKGQYGYAISDYNKALKLNPKDAAAYNNRAISYYFKKEYEKAWEDVYKVRSLGLSAHPNFLKALREASGRQK
jgi:tetratricopeptide (TPR) repeat protein